MRDLKMAAASVRAVVGDKDGNLERIRRMAVEAFGLGADFLVLPEACLTGYSVRRPMGRWAESIPGPLTEAVQQIARDYELILLVGLVEQSSEGLLFLTQVMIGPSGIIGLHRKTHLGPTEKSRFSAGTSLDIVRHQGIAYGLQLCYEGHFPEVALTQALKGAEIFLIAHASPRETPGEKLKRWLNYLPARAYDNTAFLVAVNQVGQNNDGLNFAGVALILGPKGEILAQSASREDAIITADLASGDLIAIKEGRMGYFIPARRPDIYQID